MLPNVKTVFFVIVMDAVFIKKEIRYGTSKQKYLTLSRAITTLVVPSLCIERVLYVILHAKGLKNPTKMDIKLRSFTK